MRLLCVALCYAATTGALLAQSEYFYPASKELNNAIPTPEQFLGYPIGSQHTRHDQLVAYFQKLDEASDRMSLEVIGFTYEHRPQITATITSAANQADIENIRRQHLQRKLDDVNKDTPLVIHLGYNVHGNEPSSAEAAMLTAYFLIASESAETKDWLDKMVILVDPVYNPDGRDRHSHWANMHKGSPLVSDPLDREHNEVWPGGRTNHYWFDLNRDWLLGVHPESRNRMKFFHKWRPYVMTDHHEMGTNSSFYFDPGKYSSNNPVVPHYLYDVVYPRFGDYFSKAMNSIGSLYYTKESYDKLYPGYGSSYVNFYGGAGFLFEQASSRGHVQETTTIPITFAFTIRNHFTASLATVKASFAERETLLTLRRNFYKAAQTESRSNPVKGWVFGDKNDENKNNAFVNLLLRNEVEVYRLPKDLTTGGKTFETGSAFVVPMEQESYYMVRSVFEKDITYTDSIFYDASTWSLISAFNLPYAELRSAPTKGELVQAPLAKTPTAVPVSEYAYLVSLTDYNAHKLLYKLVASDVVVQTSFKAFTANVEGKTLNFGRGTLVIPVQQQRMPARRVHEIVSAASLSCSQQVYGVSTGYSVEGIDLGSNFIRTIKQPKALMIVGEGTSAYEAGEVWHLLDQRIGMPVTKVDRPDVKDIDYSKYTVMVLVSGSYPEEKTFVDKVKGWLEGGGTLITLKTASEWAIKSKLVNEKLVPEDTVKNALRKDFADAQDIEGAKQIGGSIFMVDLDITHPIGFGFSERKVPVYRNGMTFILKGKSPYNTVAQYTPNPLIGGYFHESNLKKLASSAAIQVAGVGKGRVVLFSDNPNFRGTWYGTNKLFLNALFFGPLITTPK
jgi:hypothetical protein